jgi:hypothetical protein
MQPIRQGDVILLPIKKAAGQKLPHLTLAEGEVTGHAHRISDGRAELYEREGILYLQVLSETATLDHEEHHALEVPRGHWMVRIQREYLPQRANFSSQGRNPDLHQGLMTQGAKVQTLSPEPIAQTLTSTQVGGNSATTIEVESTSAKNKSAKNNSSNASTEKQELQNLMQQFQDTSEKELRASVWHGIPENKRLHMSVKQAVKASRLKDQQAAKQAKEQTEKTRKKHLFAYDWQKPAAWKAGKSQHTSYTPSKSYRASSSQPSTARWKSSPSDLNPKPKQPESRPRSSQPIGQQPIEQQNWRNVID